MRLIWKDFVTTFGDDMPLSNCIIVVPSYEYLRGVFNIYFLLINNETICEKLSAIRINKPFF